MEASIAGNRPAHLKTIGLIGLGRQGRRHLNEAGKLGIRVRAIDRRLDEALVGRFAGNELLRLEQGEATRLFCDDEVQAVIIATPGNTHYPLVKQALEAGKHVLVEKPFTKTLAEARELTDLARQRTLTLMVGHNRYYLPHFQRLMTMVLSGRLGEIVSVEANYLMPPQNNDRTHTALEGLGYHIFYMISALLGQAEQTVLLNGYTSADWETVGLDLQFGKVPVNVRLDRNNSGPKKRDLTVKGTKFTACFDWSHEPAFTKLGIQPTSPASIVKPEGLDALELSCLRQETLLGEMETEPSLYYQLKAFLEALHNQKTPPSDGQCAMSIVNPLERIRKQLADTRFYNSCRTVLGRGAITALAKFIHERLGEHGGLVAIDGPSGVGKSTISSQLATFYRMMYPPRGIKHFPLDEFRLFPPQCMVLKKRVLGEPLTSDETEVLKQNGWDAIQPGQVYLGEDSIWRNTSISAGLKYISRLFNRHWSEKQLVLNNPKAYLKQVASRMTGGTKHEFSSGDVIIVDGKYANLEQFAGLTNLHIRLEAPSTLVRERFEGERRKILEPEQLARHMHYYDLVIWPSWLAYAERTRPLVDFMVNVGCESSG